MPQPLPQWLSQLGLILIFQGGDRPLQGSTIVAPNKQRQWRLPELLHICELTVLKLAQTVFTKRLGSRTLTEGTGSLQPQPQQRLKGGEGHEFWRLYFR